MIGGGNFSSVLVHMLNYAEEIGRDDLWRLAVPEESPIRCRERLVYSAKFTPDAISSSMGSSLTACSDLIAAPESGW